MAGTLQDVYIVSAVRTPIAAFRASFASLGPVELGSIAGKEALVRAGVSAQDVEETVTGSVLTGGHGQNVSRQIALKAGIPETRNAYTVNKVCSSSLKALILASQSIQLGCRNVCLVVGVESMSQTPFYLARGEHGYGDIKLVDGIQRDDYQITRQQQDEYAFSSYERAANSWKNGEFQTEVVPVSVKQRRGPDLVVSEDEEFKRLIKEKVPTLPTAFTKENGTITAANASSLNDGAAALVIVSAKCSSENGLKPIGKVVAYAEGAGAPVDFTIAPVDAVHQLLKVAQIPKEKIARWEINEAFSVTVLAFMKELGLNRNIVNARGGAVALGHPIGMSGARIVVTLLHQLQPNEYGVAAICNGGGEATAILVQKC
uniref:Acetyl-CoA acetyltransferase n=1 Tax=Ditylenchus dipsaci TaxID=166011 RepID=A0A915EI25_9BILA